MIRGLLLHQHGTSVNQRQTPHDSSSRVRQGEFLRGIALQDLTDATREHLKLIKEAIDKLGIADDPAVTQWFTKLAQVLNLHYPSWDRHQKGSFTAQLRTILQVLTTEKGTKDPEHKAIQFLAKQRTSMEPGHPLEMLVGIPAWCIQAQYCKHNEAQSWGPLKGQQRTTLNPARHTISLSELRNSQTASAPSMAGRAEQQWGQYFLFSVSDLARLTLEISMSN
ncbi:hypothetical protein RHOSPDRAFT_27225 [Rhodotorula sp. JG-1b]|nr:hypothetical protein RHOSPDRAFT_27225 [Rhodotorula sp. JG-1b]